MNLKPHPNLLLKGEGVLVNDLFVHFGWNFSFPLLEERTRMRWNYPNKYSFVLVEETSGVLGR